MKKDGQERKKRSSRAANHYQGITNVEEEIVRWLDMVKGLDPAQWKRYPQAMSELRHGIAPILKLAPDSAEKFVQAFRAVGFTDEEITTHLVRGPSQRKAKEAAPDAED